jgi:hypothetical protein
MMQTSKLPIASLTPPRRAALTIAVLSALGAACQRDGPDAPAVPFGPSVAANPASVTVAPGATQAVRMVWVGGSPAPAALRWRWRVSDPAVAAVDSVAADSRTAYVRGVAPGSAALLADEASLVVSASIPLVVR